MHNYHAGSDEIGIRPQYRTEFPRKTARFYAFVQRPTQEYGYVVIEKILIGKACRPAAGAARECTRSRGPDACAMTIYEKLIAKTTATGKQHLKICILSDSHDHREPLAAAVAEAKALGAEAVLHCGDLVTPSTLHAVIGLGLPIHLIHGNNTGDLFNLCKFGQEPKNRVHYYGQDASPTLAQRRIFLVHYPHYAKAMALTGDFDLVCNGHEHRAVIERIRNIKGGETLRIDPGTVAGVSAPATYVFGDLKTLEFEIRKVPL